MAAAADLTKATAGLLRALCSPCESARKSHLAKVAQCLVDLLERVTLEAAHVIKAEMVSIFINRVEISIALLSVADFTCAGSNASNSISSGTSLNTTPS